MLIHQYHTRLLVSVGVVSAVRKEVLTPIGEEVHLTS
jgi:hypothetical protein